LFGGNQSRIKPELGINMGSYGWHLTRRDSGQMELLPASTSGLFVRGEIRDFETLIIKGNRYLLVGKNNDNLEWFELKELMELNNE
jgi:hypothetical protein